MNRLFALITAASLTVGCASGAGKVYVEADTKVVNTLLDFKAAKDVRCDANEIPASTCQAISQAFVPVFDAYITVNSLIAAEAPINEVDAAIAKFRGLAVVFKDVLSKVEGNARQILLDLLEAAIRKFDK